MAEETKGARTIAPRGIITTCLASGAVGLVYILVLLFASPDVRKTLAGPTDSAVINVYVNATGHNFGSFLAWLIVINLFFAGKLCLCNRSLVRSDSVCPLPSSRFPSVTLFSLNFTILHVYLTLSPPSFTLRLCSGVSSCTVTGRITYALMRDGAFPYAAYWAQVHPRTKAPLR